MRRCYEMQVSADDLKVLISDHMPLDKAAWDSAEYRLCCNMLYHSYAETHKSISPLIASLGKFCRDLPGMVIFRMGNGKIMHWHLLKKMK